MLSRNEYDGAGKAAALVRWKEGHQALHVYLVAINTVIYGTANALKDNDQPKISSCLGRLAALYDAATATMQYSADFPRQLYENTVRPSMAPPMLPPGFSGKLNTEHRQMVAAFKQLSRAIRASYGRNTSAWPGEISRQWTAVQLAKTANLKRHDLICSQFVSNSPSLLRSLLGPSSLQDAE
jgi:hypothetical protein